MEMTHTLNTVQTLFSPALSTFIGAAGAYLFAQTNDARRERSQRLSDLIYRSRSQEFEEASSCLYDWVQQHKHAEDQKAIIYAFVAVLLESHSEKFTIPDACKVEYERCVALIRGIKGSNNFYITHNLQKILEFYGQLQRYMAIKLLDSKETSTYFSHHLWHYKDFFYSLCSVYQEKHKHLGLESPLPAWLNITDLLASWYGSPQEKKASSLKR
jgi:hypothetical protein